jgi:hypothetical protein
MSSLERNRDLCDVLAPPSNDSAPEPFELDEGSLALNRADTPPEDLRYTVLTNVVEPPTREVGTAAPELGACPLQNPRCPRYRPPPQTPVGNPTGPTAPAAQPGPSTYQGPATQAAAEPRRDGVENGTAAPQPGPGQATDSMQRQVRYWANTAPYNRTFLDQIHPSAVPPYVEPVRDANGVTRLVLTCTEVPRVDKKN